MERPGAVNANAGAKEPAQGAAFFPTLFHLRRFRTDRAARTSFSSFWTHFQKEIAFLGTESSPAFVRAPEGNGCAERFIRTLKENLLWVRTFETIEELRQALLEFRDAYNAAWLIERHGFISPIEFREKRLRVRASRMFRYPSSRTSRRPRPAPSISATAPRRTSIVPRRRGCSRRGGHRSSKRADRVHQRLPSVPHRGGGALQRGGQFRRMLDAFAVPAMRRYHLLERRPMREHREAPSPHPQTRRRRYRYRHATFICV